jgi:hypothetical protein
MFAERMRRQAWRYADGLLTHDECEELSDALNRDPAARRIFWCVMRLHANLVITLRGSRSGQNVT